MLIYDIIPPAKLKKVAKEILGIKDYRTKKEKVLNIGLRLIFFFLFFFFAFNNFFPFNSLEKAIKKILADDFKISYFYPQIRENSTTTFIFRQFLPKENIDFEKTEFKEAKIKIVFDSDEISNESEESDALKKIEKFLGKIFDKNNILARAEKEIENNQLLETTNKETENEEEEMTSEEIKEERGEITNNTVKRDEVVVEEEIEEGSINQENSINPEVQNSLHTLSLWYSLDNEFWIKLTDISTSSQELEIDANFLKSFAEVESLILKIEGEDISQVKIKEIFLEVSFIEIKRENFEIIPLKNVFKIGERPIFEIRKLEEEEEGIFERILEVLKETPEVKVKIENAKREKFELKEDEDFLAESHSPVKIEILNDQTLRPGVNKIEVDFELDGQTYHLESNFVFGVLAINTSKSIYLPGEKVFLQMAALREDGHTLCDANLKLEIETPRGEIFEPEIEKSGECGPNNVTDKPDYFAFFETKEIGTYKMKLKNLDRGWEIEDFFEVREKIPFDIERRGPTRIWPKSPYEMKIKIRGNEDFEGEIVERVPLDFEITRLVNCQLRVENNEKEIVWQGLLPKGQEIEISYQFDPPDISPYLYLVGPLSIKEKNKNFLGMEFSGKKFEEIRQWQITSDSPGTSIKTVEFFIYQYTSATNITGGAGINNLTYSDDNDVSFTINLPESGIVVRRAIVEWRTVYLGSAAITAGEMKFRRTGQANKTLTLASASYPINASSGENIPMVFRMEVSDQIASGTNTYYFNAQLTGGVRNTDNAKIYITYEYDENSFTQLKTNKFFIGCRTTNAPAGTTDNYTINPGIGETSAQIQQYWIEYYSKRDNGNNVNDTGFQVVVNGTAGSTAILDGGNRTNYSTITLHPNNATLNLNANNTIGLTNLTSATNLKCAELVITYTINYIDESDLLRTNTVIYPIGQLSGDIISTAAPGVSLGTQNIYLPEVPTSSLVIKGVWLRYWQFQDNTHNITLRAVMNGNSTDTTFTVQSNVQEITGPSYILFDVTNFFAQNFNNNGKTFEIRVWASVSGAAESPGGELVITYEYPAKLATTSIKTVYWWVGQEANNDHNSDFLDTTLNDQLSFSTFIPESTITKRASVVMADYLVLNISGANSTRIHRFAVDRISTPPDCTTPTSTRDLASASYVDTGEQNEAPMMGFTPNSMLDSTQEDIKFRFCLDNYTNSPKVVSPLAYTTYEYPLPFFPKFTQKAVIFQNDDAENVNSNSTSTSPNQPIYVEKGERLIFRVQIENDGFGSGNALFNLQFASTSQDCTSSLNWIPVSENNEIALGFGLSGDNGTELSEAIIASSSYHWLKGRWLEGTSNSGFLTFNASSFTELAFVLHTGKAIANAHYCLRLTANGEIFHSYLNYGMVFVTASPEIRYSKEATSSLPSSNIDLGYYLDRAGYLNTSIQDQSYDSIFSSSSIPIFLFAKKHQNNFDAIEISWRGKSTIAPSLGAVVMEIWNGQSWEEIARNNTAGADEDFSLQGVKVGQKYYDNENWIYARVWQFAGTQNLKTDFISFNFLPTITISGKVFSDEGINPLTTQPIVSLVVNGDWQASTTASTTDGSFFFLLLPPATSSIITVYLDNSSEKGTTITKYVGSGNIENLDIYQKRIIINSDSLEVNISDLDHFDGNDDEDILYFASSSAGTLTCASTSEFLVFENSVLRAEGEGVGNLEFSDLEIRGTFYATSNQTIYISCQGGMSCFDAFPGNFYSASSTVEFSGPGTRKITAGNNPFWNLKFNHPNGEWQFEDSRVIIRNDLEILTGNVIFPSEDFFIGGNFLNNGNFNHNFATTTFNSEMVGKTINAGSSPFYNVVFDSLTGGWQIVHHLTSLANFEIKNANSFIVSAGVIIEVQGEYKISNNIPSITEWQTGSILYLNAHHDYSIGSKNQDQENYSILKIGPSTSIAFWNSDAQSFDVDSKGGLAIRNYNQTNGLLYIKGEYQIASGGEYWSYSKDFDGSLASRQCQVLIENGSTIILNGGFLEIVGTTGATTTISTVGTGTYSFQIQAGNFLANYYQFRNLDNLGLQIFGDANIQSLDNGDFELAVEGGRLITIEPTVIEKGRKNFSNIRFATSTFAQFGYNVYLNGSPNCSPLDCHWRFSNHSGGLDGENFDFDPGDASPGWIQWDDSVYYRPRSQNWRFYFDYNKETPEEPAASLNSAPSEIGPRTILKLRISVKEIAGFDGENVKMRLQYSTSPDFSENVYFIAEKENCTDNDVWCYADGIDEDNVTITQLLLPDSQIPATHNESGISTSTFFHPASSTAEWEFTIKNNQGEEGIVYYFRLYDETFYQPVLTNDGYSYPSILVESSQLSFNIEGLPAGTSTEGVFTTIDTQPERINFTNLQANTSQIAAHRFRISTNAAFGYQLFVFEDDRLRNEKGQNLQPFPCSNESPCAWNYWKNLKLPSVYGYHTGDDLLAGNSNRFAPDDSYACFENTPKEIAYHPFPAFDHIFDFVFRIETRENQFPGNYWNQIIYLLVPTF